MPSNQLRMRPQIDQPTFSTGLAKTPGGDLGEAAKDVLDATYRWADDNRRVYFCFVSRDAQLRIEEPPLRRNVGFLWPHHELDNVFMSSTGSEELKISVRGFLDVKGWVPARDWAAVVGNITGATEVLREVSTGRSHASPFRFDEASEAESPNHRPEALARLAARGFERTMQARPVRRRPFVQWG